MATYRMDPEPTADVVWLTPREGGAPIECRRSTRADAPGWFRHGVDATATFTWPELLGMGQVSDVHPELADVDHAHPLPWRDDWRDGAGYRVLDARGGVVCQAAHHSGPLIARAVNALAEQISRGQVPATPALDWAAPLPGCDALTDADCEAPRHVDHGGAVTFDKWVHPKGTPGRTIGELANATDDVLGNGHGHPGAGVIVRLGGWAAYATELRWAGTAGVFVISAGEPS